MIGMKYVKSGGNKEQRTDVVVKGFFSFLLYKSFSLFRSPYRSKRKRKRRSPKQPSRWTELTTLTSSETQQEVADMATMMMMIIYSVA